MRGQVFTVVISLACVPWKIIASAQSFLTFLGSYVCFLGPIIGVTVTDYFLVRKGNIHIPSMYNGSRTSPYWYWHGFNVRMYAAWSAGFAITIHGVAGSFQTDYSPASRNMYYLSLELAPLVAALCYYAICHFWPVQIFPPGREDAPRTFEYLGRTDGFFEDEFQVSVDRGIGNSAETGSSGK